MGVSVQHYCSTRFAYADDEVLFNLTWRFYGFFPNKRSRCYAGSNPATTLVVWRSGQTRKILGLLTWLLWVRFPYAVCCVSSTVEHYTFNVAQSSIARKMYAQQRKRWCFCRQLRKISVQILHSQHNPKKELFFEKRIALAVRLQFTIAYNVQLHNNQQPFPVTQNLPISVSVGG